MNHTKASSRSTARRAAELRSWAAGAAGTVAVIESSQAVAVRLAPMWIGAAPAIIATERIVEDLSGVPVTQGCVVRVPTFAKAVNFQVVRTIPSGPVVIGPRTDIRVVEGEQTAARAPAVSYEDMAAWKGKSRGCAKWLSCR